MKKIYSFQNFLRVTVMSTLLNFAFLINLAAAPVPNDYLNPKTDSVCQGRDYSLVFSNGNTSVVLSYNGKIVFTDDERDIKSITPGGFFRYSKTTFGNKREIYIQSGSDGALSRKYYVGRAEQPYEPEGRRWLQEMLPEIIATSGIGAEDRIRRIYAKTGAKGVLTEIANIDSDHTQSTYYSLLLDQPALKENELRAVLTHLDEEIDSDHEKSKLLRKVGPRYLQHEKVTQEYISIVTNMDSDYEKSRVFTYVLQNAKLTPDKLSIIVPAVAHISSDYDQAKVLKSVLVNPAATPQVHKVVIGQLNNMSSDYDKCRVLAQLMANPKYVNANFEALLNVINNLDSDYDKSKALMNLMSNYKLTAQNYLQIFPVVSNIDSNHEKSRVLQKIRTAMPADNAQVRAAYIKTAKSIDSEYEYHKAISGL